ncbi:Fc.00g018370.m01.CDS01 [Cosmosporella sp. VM-42]
MPGMLNKTRKQISKKRGGVLPALHAKSRDSMRLHKAAIRDQRVEKLAASRYKKEKPLVDRVAFFQTALRSKEAGCTLTVGEVQEMIHNFVHQYDEEYDAVKKTRRPGRPASTQEDILKMRISALEEEYKKGFLLPDLLIPENINQLHLWEGSWSYLPKLKWAKVNSAGETRAATFPGLA